VVKSPANFDAFESHNGAETMPVPPGVRVKVSLGFDQFAYGILGVERDAETDVGIAREGFKDVPF
jgi:hypothetical protein